MKISIFGLTRFGTLIASILSKDFDVSVFHYREGDDVNIKIAKTGAKKVDFDMACNVDILIIAAPISDTEEYIKRIASKAKPGSLICDVCSAKVYPCEWLKKHVPEEIEIMGTHPMFGPNSTSFDLEKQAWSLKDLQIVLCPLRVNSDRLKKIKQYLDSKQLEIIETTPEDHDYQNAMTLSLVHFLGRSLWEAGVRDDKKIFTPGFKRVTSIFRHTVNDSWQLFYDMHNFNPYAREVRQNFIKACQGMDKKIEENK